MGEVNCCQRCGRQLPQGDALGGRCPHCMLELGFESEAGIAKEFETTINPALGEVPGNDSRPTVLGQYRILRLIGEGGMGAVYEAEQSQPRRTVALKIIKPGMASPELLRRFEQESQALGRLQHPGIAQIDEAGTVDTGLGPQPYFAMELIRGFFPRDYAETHHLNVGERLEIMAKICEAVHHAHQRGLIHRDLKPANILIDEAGQPKILDFGVARATDSDTRATVQTDLGQLIGTLAYMSPEQVLADPLDIDTRSDVYSLGVILYEFLSGRLPYPISKKLHENIQTIREEDPAKLSSVNRTFRGDIENIVAKALEKDRVRRYASAEGMAEDIRRYLKDEPIVARSPSSSYKIWKFALRHKALVAAATTVCVVLIGGMTLGRRQVQREYTEFFEELNERDQAALYDKGSQSALTYGQRELAKRLLERSLDIQKVLLARYRNAPDGEDSGLTRQLMGRVAITLARLERYVEAEEILKQMIEIERTARGVSAQSKLMAIADLGWVQFHHKEYVAAEASLREAELGFENIKGNGWIPFNTESMFGAALIATKKYAEAEGHLLNSHWRLVGLMPASGSGYEFTAESQPGERILTLYQEWGKPEKVEEWRRKLLTAKNAASSAASTK